MSASIYAVELFRETDPVKTPISFAFEILSKIYENATDLHTIKLVSMGSKIIKEEYAVAKTINYEYCGTVLKSIRYNGASYRPAPHNEFWFPTTLRPANLTQDSMLLYISDSPSVSLENHSIPTLILRSGIVHSTHVVVVVPVQNGISYLTSTGVFCEEYVMIKQRLNDEWTDCNISVLLFDIKTDAITLLNRETKTTHSIRFDVTFNEMPIIGISEQ